MVTNVEQLIKRHEGFRPDVYLDQFGNRTVGYGHLILEDQWTVGDTVAPIQIDQWYHDDQTKAMLDAIALVGSVWVLLNDVRQAVLIDLAFNLGRTKLSRFVHFLNAVRNQDWQAAAGELENSAWAAQVPRRAKEDTVLLLKGYWDALPTE